MDFFLGFEIEAAFSVFWNVSGLFLHCLLVKVPEKFVQKRRHPWLCFTTFSRVLPGLCLPSYHESPTSFMSPALEKHHFKECSLHFRNSEIILQFLLVELVLLLMG